MSALSQMEDIDGWYPLGALGNRLIALPPDFDSRTYGSAKLVSVVEKSEAFEVKRSDLKVMIRPKF